MSEAERAREIAERAMAGRANIPMDQNTEHWGATADDCEAIALEALRAGRLEDLTEHIKRQRRWSEQTFGPGKRTGGLLAHIRKELAEIERDPGDILEWIDVVILALDGAWRHGWTPEQIVAALREKQRTNELREWPDWRKSSEGEAIEHVHELEGGDD